MFEAMDMLEPAQEMGWVPGRQRVSEVPSLAQRAAQEAASWDWRNARQGAGLGLLSGLLPRPMPQLRPPPDPSGHTALYKGGQLSSSKAYHEPTQPFCVKVAIFTGPWKSLGWSTGHAVGARASPIAHPLGFESGPLRICKFRTVPGHKASHRQHCKLRVRPALPRAQHSPNGLNSGQRSSSVQSAGICKVRDCINEVVYKAVHG